MLIGTLNLECAVRPLSISNDVILDVATASTTFPSDMRKLISLPQKDFSSISMTINKKQSSVPVLNICGNNFVYIHLFSFNIVKHLLASSASACLSYIYSSYNSVF